MSRILTILLAAVQLAAQDLSPQEMLGRMDQTARSGGPVSLILAQGRAAVSGLRAEDAPSAALGEAASRLARWLIQFNATDDAVRYCQLALEMTEQANVVPPLRLLALHNAALLASRQGDPSTAEAHLQEGMARGFLGAGRAHRGAEHIGMLLGELLVQQNRLPEADAVLAKTLTVLQQRQRVPPAFTARLLLTVSQIALKQRDFERCNRVLQRATELADSQPGSGPIQADILHTKARLDMARDNPEHVHRSLSACQAIWEQLGNLRGAAAAMSSQASYHANRGELDAAYTLQKEAIDKLRQNDSSVGHPLFASGLHNLGRYALAQGKLLSARQAFQEVLTEASPATKATQADAHASLALLEARQGRTSEALARLASAITLNQTLGRRRCDFAIELATGPLAEQDEAHQAAYAVLQMPDHDSTLRRCQLAKNSDKMDLLATIYQDWTHQALRIDPAASLAGIHRRLRSFSESLEDPAPPQAVSRPPEQAVLLQFAHYTPRSNGFAQRSHLALFAVFADGQARAYSLGASEPIEETIRALQAALRSPQNTDWHHLTGKLSAQLLGPVLPNLASDQAILIKADGMTHLVPFSLLTERPVRVITAAAAATTGAPAGRAAVFAAPDFEAVLGMPEASGLHFAPLPDAERESEIIAEQLETAVIRTGPQATEAALKDLTSPRILHLATRSYSLDRGHLSPWLRVGLALAGANHFTKRGNDGILSALELATLDLAGTRCVAITGSDLDANAVEHLTNALTAAGAQSVLLSHGSTDPAARSVLLQHFYKALHADSEPTQALQTAKNVVQQTAAWQHPHYWATFTLFNAPPAYPPPPTQGTP